jgi:outer membrane lipoprotein-sorting protein
LPDHFLSRRSLTALALAAVAAPALAAKAPPPPPLTIDEQALVSKAIASLQSLSSGKGDFVQTDARGAVSQGTFYLQRPG